MQDVFSLCWMLLWIACGSTLPIDTEKEFKAAVPKGSSCRTREGKEGECISIAVCAEYLSVNSSLSSDCQRKGYPKTVLCCSSSFHGNPREISQKKKREAPPPPPDVPKLRVKGCGIRRSLTDFVMGGEEADYWPWMAAIFTKRPGAKTKTFTCGGAVISKNYILTAAHCVGQTGKTILANTVRVRVGDLKRSDGQEFPVRSITVHENYKDSTHYDDIALLKTSQPMEAKNVVPVCLPSPGMYNSNFFQRNAIVLGWGDMNYGGVSSESLREAVIPVVPNKRCDRRYKRLSTMSLPRGIIDTQLCAGAQDGSRDACQGDSGGPLLLEDRSGKWNIVGIVSFGYRCGEPDYPGVYTKVAKYLKWLARHTDIPARPYP